MISLCRIAYWGALILSLTACDKSQKENLTVPNIKAVDEKAGTLTGGANSTGPQTVEPVKSVNDTSSVGDDQWINDLTELATTDLKKALLLAQENSDVKLRQKAVLNIAMRLCAGNLDRLPEILPEIKTGKLREGVVNALASYWANKDPKYGFDFAKTKLGGLDKNMFMQRAAAKVVGEGNFELGALLVEEMPFSAARSSIVFRMANSWAAKDLASAYGWAKTLPLSEDKIAAMKELVRSASNVEDIGTLTNLVNESTERELRNAGVAKIVQVLTSGGKETEALEWLGKLPPDVKAQAQVQLVKSLGASDMAKWTAYALQIKDSAAFNSAIESLAGTAFEQGTQSATQWIEKLPDTAKDAAVSSLVYRWYDTDSEALSDWIGTLPFGKQRDKSIEVLADCLSRSDLVAAKEMASKIGDKNTKDRVMTRLGKFR